MCPVGLDWVGKHSGSKTLAGARGREACGIPSGGCKDSFNLSIPPCPQQLLETEGFKTPRAETHKSRLGWNKKEEETRGEEDDGGDSSSQIWNTAKARLLRRRSPVSHSRGETGPRAEARQGALNVGHLPSDNRLPLGVFRQMPRLTRTFSGGLLRFALLCCVCKRTAQNIHILSRTAERRVQTQREQLQKGGETCKRTAWHLELVSNCTRISAAPAVNQLIRGAVKYVLNPPGATSVAYLRPA